MNSLLTFFTENTNLLFLVASFIGGVAVFYIVMQRTRRKRADL